MAAHAQNGGKRRRGTKIFGRCPSLFFAFNAAGKEISAISSFFFHAEMQGPSSRGSFLASIRYLLFPIFLSVARVLETIVKHRRFVDAVIALYRKSTPFLWNSPDFIGSTSYCNYVVCAGEGATVGCETPPWKPRRSLSG